MNPLVNNSSANPLQKLGEFKRNPAGILNSVGYKIPQGMNDPNQIVNHLMSSGQLNNTRFGQIQQMARRFGLIR